MADVNWIEYKDKSILFVNCKDCENENEMISVLIQAQMMVIEQNKEYYQLTDLSGSFATPNFIKTVKKIARETPKLAKKRAIVGVNSQARKVLLRSYNLLIGKNSVVPFNTIEEAKEWLVL